MRKKVYMFCIPLPYLSRAYIHLNSQILSRWEFYTALFNLTFHSINSKKKTYTYIELMLFRYNKNERKGREERRRRRNPHLTSFLSIFYRWVCERILVYLLYIAACSQTERIVIQYVYVFIVFDVLFYISFTYTHFYFVNSNVRFCWLCVAI